MISLNEQRNAARQFISSGIRRAVITVTHDQGRDCGEEEWSEMTAV